MNRFVANVGAIAYLFAAAVLYAAPPNVTHVVPAGVMPGQSTSITLHGENVGQAVALWTNLPGVESSFKPPEPAAAKDKTDVTSATFQIKVPKDAPLGAYGLRLVTRNGVSNLRLLVVDDLPTVREVKQHSTVETAQEIQLPAVVEGATETEAYDFYKFRATAGQRLSVEMVARRIGSPLDPVVRLIDSRGRELIYSDDDPATGPDGRFVHRFEAEGDYLLEVRDVRYQGNSTYRYRLRLGDFPLATAPFPLAGCVASTARLTIAGRDLDKLPPVDLLIPPGSADAEIAFPVRYPKGQGSAVVHVLRGGLEQVEFEPNDKPEQATAIDATGAINGRFERAGDRDLYTFTADAKQRIVFTGQARSLGAPTDLFLRLLDDKGTQLAEVDDTEGEEGVIDHTFAAKGTYRLVVEDLLNASGPDRLYRIEIGATRAPFALAADGERYNAPQAGVFAVKVTATRRSHKGAIDLSLAGAEAERCKLSGNKIAEGKNDTTMLVTVPADMPPGSFAVLSIVGQAKIGEATATASATSLAALRTALNGLNYPPAELTRDVAIGIGPKFADFIALEKPAAAVAFPQQSGEATVSIKAKRMNKFDGPITLKVEGLPPEFSTKAATIAKGKDTETLTITGPKNIALGKFALRVVASATFQDQPQSTVIELPLEIVPPAKAKASAKKPKE
ncbi:MAG TPA: PPC domain-containing protein [Pirellulales bacterium]|nr:PPC domain-containing protein [Pirellulales bacterium]